jgi:hypothetical protein
MCNSHVQQICVSLISISSLIGLHGKATARRRCSWYSNLTGLMDGYGFVKAMSTPQHWPPSSLRRGSYVGRVADCRTGSSNVGLCTSSPIRQGAKGAVLWTLEAEGQSFRYYLVLRARRPTFRQILLHPLSWHILHHGCLCLRRCPHPRPRLTQQGRQCVAAYRGHSSQPPEYSGPCRSLWRHRQEEMGHQLGLHVLPRLCGGPNHLGRVGLQSCL